MDILVNFCGLYNNLGNMVKYSRERNYDMIRQSIKEFNNCLDKMTLGNGLNNSEFTKELLGNTKDFYNNINSSEKYSNLPDDESKKLLLEENEKDLSENFAELNTNLAGFSNDFIDMIPSLINDGKIKKDEVENAVKFNDNIPSEIKEKMIQSLNKEKEQEKETEQPAMEEKREKTEDELYNIFWNNVDSIEVSNDRSYSSNVKGEIYDYKLALLDKEISKMQAKFDGADEISFSDAVKYHSKLSQRENLEKQKSELTMDQTFKDKRIAKREGKIENLSEKIEQQRAKAVQSRLFKKLKMKSIDKKIAKLRTLQAKQGSAKAASRLKALKKINRQEKFSQTISNIKSFKNEFVQEAGYIYNDTKQLVSKGVEVVKQKVENLKAKTGKLTAVPKKITLNRLLNQENNIAPMQM